MNDWINRAVTWFVIIDPVGTLPLYLALTGKMSPERRLKVASKAILIAGVVLLGYVALGQILLNALGITLPAFRLAGGIILFLLGLQMVFDSGHNTGPHLHEEPGRDVAVFPLAIPSLAGPGSVMAAIVMTESGRFSPLEQAGNIGLMLGVLGITWMAFRFAEPIQKKIGETGANVISRVMGMILCALAVQAVVESLQAMLAAGASASGG
jgi:multiple antibiotic resistance protein